MHEIVSFNCTHIASNEASVSALSSASLYGNGVFTTIPIYNREPLLWEKHWHRLETNSEKLNIDIAEFSENTTRQALAEIVKKKNCINGRARITFFDELPSTIWPLETTRKTSLLITTGDLRPIPDDFRLTVAPYRVNSLSPLAGVKSCNYLDKILTLDEAKSRGFDEAIQTDERGEITSAAMANVFWLKNGMLYTPSLKTGCLPGTTREFVMENLECREVEAMMDELTEADAIFLTSAGLGVVQISEFEGKKLPALKHPISDLIPKILY